jgi:hypothetical protein
VLLTRVAAFVKRIYRWRGKGCFLRANRMVCGTTGHLSTESDNLSTIYSRPPVCSFPMTVRIGDKFVVEYLTFDWIQRGANQSIDWPCGPVHASAVPFSVIRKSPCLGAGGADLA